MTTIDERQIGGSRWRDLSACREVADPEIFFPISKNETEKIAQAKAICASCPVQLRCLAIATDYGIYGGLTEDERRSKRRQARARQETRSCNRCGKVIPRREGDSDTSYRHRKLCDRYCPGDTAKTAAVLEVEHLLDLGLDKREIATSLAITPGAVDVRCRRAGRRDLLTRLATGTSRHARTRQGAA